MIRTSVPRFALVALGCLCTAGCEYDTQCRVDGRVGGLGGCPVDTTPPPSPPAQGIGAKALLRSIPSPPPAPTVSPISRADEEALRARQNSQPERADVWRPVAYEAPVSAQPPRSVQPLEIPSAIPAHGAPLAVPPARPGETPAERSSQINSALRRLGRYQSHSRAGSAPGQAPLTLAQLQSIAVTRNPLIRQAASDVEAARGNMIQAGAYPNPHVGYQADDINTGATAGYQGGAIAQTIVTGGKLRLAKASAEVDLQNAEVALQRARFDLATQVRSNYLGVLVALERIKVNDALAQFAARVYRLQAKRVAAGQAAAYEPLQLRVLAVQAQTQLIQSNQQYIAASRTGHNAELSGNAPEPFGGTH